MFDTVCFSRESNFTDCLSHRGRPRPLFTSQFIFLRMVPKSAKSTKIISLKKRDIHVYDNLVKYMYIPTCMYTCSHHCSALAGKVAIHVVVNVQTL